MPRKPTTTDDSTRVPALDTIRPPAERLVGTYDIPTDDGGIEHVTLDEPVPERELPDDAETGSFQLSLDELNAQNDFVIVHERIVPSDEDHPTGGKRTDFNQSGFIRFLAPKFTLDCETFWDDADQFDTWQAAEAFIAEHFEQPDAEHEHIVPKSSTEVFMAIQRYLHSDNTDGQEPRTTFFHENVPTDDAFFQDAISIDE